MSTKDKQIVKQGFRNGKLVKIFNSGFGWKIHILYKYGVISSLHLVET